MPNTQIVVQHAEETAFLWTLRSRAIAAPHYLLKDLSALDERIEAHLDGLRIAGDVGWRLCQTNLANDGPGEVFALSVLAFGAGHGERMRDAVNAGCASPKIWPGLVSALGWLEYESVSPWLEMLLKARSALHRRVAIAACAIHRRDPGAVLTFSVDDPDILLRARALRAVGELKRHDLADHLKPHLNDEDDVCKFWAAWSLTLLGMRDQSHLLLRFAQSGHILSIPALQLGLRALSPVDSRRWLSSFSAEPDSAWLTIVGAGVIGDPATVPWLINKMSSPALARLAGEAFTMITGIDLNDHGLYENALPSSDGESPDPGDREEESLNYESDLPWPSPNLVAKWWDQNRGAFVPGTRYLLGQPISTRSALDVLARGSQRQRSAAALELALLEPTNALWEIRSPGRRQRKLLPAPV